MRHQLYVVGPRDRAPSGAVVVNTTSRSKDFGRAFSPFLNQGPITISGLTSKNVENLWQFTKFYPEHEKNGKREWRRWRDDGLQDEYAHRYPMGKGARPLCSILDGERLSYVEARKKIYIPAFRQKLKLYCIREICTLMDMLTVTSVALWDFDGRLTSQPWKELVNDEHHKLGHAFVIQNFVERKRAKETDR